jgi:hypothetical protein
LVHPVNVNVEVDVNVSNELHTGFAPENGGLGESSRKS